jgi:hypothetical protein
MNRRDSYSTNYAAINVRQRKAPNPRLLPRITRINSDELLQAWRKPIFPTTAKILKHQASDVGAECMTSAPPLNKAK